MSESPFARSIEPLEPRRLCSAAAPIPRPDHVVVVVEENHSQKAVIGSPDAPYISSLARQGAVLSDYLAVTHPSQPNYIAMFSGSTQGVYDNRVPTRRFTAPSLGGQLVAAGLDFGGFSEDMPYTGFFRPGYRNYHRRHNPWVNFADVPPTDNMPFTHFPRPGGYDALPEVSFVVPNLLNDMHDGTVRQGDDWLRAKLDPYVQWAKTHNSLLVITYDEDDYYDSNRVPTIVVGAGVTPGSYSQPLNHYSLLRTLEEMYGLPPLGQAATARPIDMIWGSPAERTTRLAPEADAFVFDDAPAGNYGRSPELYAKSSTVAGVNRDAYFKFDVSSLAADTLGSVRLRFKASLSAQTRVATSLFAVADTGWSETGITWDNRPAMGPAVGTTAFSSSLSLWYEIDLTAYVKARREAGHDVISLALHNTENSAAKATINSREAASDRPELVVVRV
jgi:acid phosphatase